MIAQEREREKKKEAHKSHKTSSFLYFLFSNEKILVVAWQRNKKEKLAKKERKLLTQPNQQPTQKKWEKEAKKRMKYW